MPTVNAQLEDESTMGEVEEKEREYFRSFGYALLLFGRVTSCFLVSSPTGSRLQSVLHLLQDLLLDLALLCVIPTLGAEDLVFTLLSAFLVFRLL